MTGEETKNWKFHHLGVIVADLDRAIEYYQSLGIVDFPPKKTKTGKPLTWEELTIYGKPVVREGHMLVAQTPEDRPLRSRFCWIGSMPLELIQPCQGSLKDVNGDFLENVGEGIDHICYLVDTEYFEQEVEKMKAKGIEIIFSGRRSDGPRFAYFDVRKVGGIIIELAESFS